MTPTVPESTRPEIVLPDVKMNLYRPTAPVTARIHRTVLCTSRKAAGIVRHIEFDVGGTLLEGQCRPGQAFGVIPPGADERGKPHKVRLYSLASPSRGEDGARKIISTTVKRTIDEHWETHRLFLGVASNYLCDLKEGDEVLLSGPNGKRFLIPSNHNDFDYFFFATGTGIAPFRGMLLDLLESGCKSRIVLLAGAPYATDLLYHDFFLRLEQEHETFTYIPALSRQAQPDGHDPMYVQDRLRTERDRLMPMLSGGRALAYICGVAGMEVGIFQQMAMLLNGEALERFLLVDKDALGHIHRWDRKMIHKEVRPTERVFMEVYA